METERAPQTIVALYATLADAESALAVLEAAGVPYPAMRLAAHTPADLDRAEIAQIRQRGSGGGLLYNSLHNGRDMQASCRMVVPGDGEATAGPLRGALPAPMRSGAGSRSALSTSGHG